MRIHKDYSTIMRAGRKPFKAIFRKQQESGWALGISVALAAVLVLASVLIQNII